MWKNRYLHNLFSSITEEDYVQADLQNITVKQYLFNKWLDELEKYGDGFKTGFRSRYENKFSVKLTWWKCWFWWCLPDLLLEVDNPIYFSGWKIGHCLNCDANPYDGQVEAWSYDNGWCRGALIRCNKCGQLRWQPVERGLVHDPSRGI